MIKRFLRTFIYSLKKEKVYFSKTQILENSINKNALIFLRILSLNKNNLKTFTVPVHLLYHTNF